MSSILNIIVVLLPAILRLALCYMVLRDKRVQETAMAWVLLMLFVPLIGFVLYIIFGKDYRTVKARNYIHGEARRRLQEEISQASTSPALTTSTPKQDLPTPLRSPMTYMQISTRTSS